MRELAIAYGVTAVAMLAGLLLMRADARAYLRWPVYSAMAMALGVGVVEPAAQAPVAAPSGPSRIRARCITARCGLYSVLGFALGLLLGRLTRA